MIIAVYMGTVKHRSKCIEDCVNGGKKERKGRRAGVRRTGHGIRKGLICVLAASLLVIPVDAAIRIPRAQEEQVRLLIHHGIPYERAVIGTVSDTPTSIAR